MKKITRKLLTSIALPLSLLAIPAQASTFPEKPVRIIVPYPAGGSTDALARTVGQKLGGIFGQPVIVENRAGASGNIGASYVAQSEPDGYTLFLGTSTALSVNEHLYKDLPYNPQKDFAPIVLATMLPNLLVTSLSLDVNSVEELNALLKEKGEAINYASASNGTPSHLGGELYKQMTGTSARHIPYKGGAPALVDLVGGQTDYMLAILPEAMPLVKSGKLRGLAMTTSERLPAYPDIPTVSEAGVPGYELIGWFAFMAPAATPKDVLNELNRAFDEALQDPETKNKLEQMGFEVVGGPAQKLTDLMRSESAKWKKVIDDVGIKID